MRRSLLILCLLSLAFAGTAGTAFAQPGAGMAPPQGEEDTGDGVGVDSDTDDDMLGHDEVGDPDGGGEEVDDGSTGLPVDDDEPPPPPPPDEEDDGGAPPIPGATDDPAGGGGGAGSGTDIPIHFDLHGYFRARLVHMDNHPIPGVGGGNDTLGHAAYGFMRLRLDPAIIFGSDRNSPIAALRMQIDGLDNVVFGDNARLTGTPLFANDPSQTSIIDGDLDSWFRMRRLWLEFNALVGQIRIGRMGSQGGLGILFNDGNDFQNDFGDALDGTTFDRILFATRPLTVFNTLTRNDSSPTPLIFAIAYDWLAEDTLGALSDPAARRSGPFSFLNGGADDVYQTTLVLVWRDEEFNAEVNARDELTAGLYLVYRGQDYTRSDVYIGDLFWNLKYSILGRNMPALYTAGELYTIQGTTNAVALTGDLCSNPAGCMDMDGNPIAPGTTATTLGANIWGGAFRVGADAERWTAYMETGFSTGQPGRLPVGFQEFAQRPNNPAYQVGLLLYPVALAVRTAAGYGEALDAIWSNGGVWNSVYFLPRLHIRPLNGLEIIGQFILAFADQANPPLALPAGRTPDFENPRAWTGCGLDEQCLLGWEADLALKLSWGPHDEMRWSTEFGIANPGPALGGRIQESPSGLTGELNAIMWTLQTRIAFVF